MRELARWQELCPVSPRPGEERLLEGRGTFLASSVGFCLLPVQGQENRISFSNCAFENCSKPDTFLIQNVFTAFGSLMEQREQIKMERPYIFFN